MSSLTFLGASVFFAGLALIDVGAELIERSFRCHCTPVYIFQRPAYQEDCNSEATTSENLPDREGDAQE